MPQGPGHPKGWFHCVPPAHAICPIRIAVSSQYGSHPLPCRVSRRPFQTHPKRGMSRNVKRGVSDNTMCLCVPQSAQVYPDSGQKIPTPARPKPFGEDTAPETFWSQLFIKSDYRMFPSGLSQNYICGIARGVSLEDGRLQTDCRDLEVEQPRWW